MRKRLIDSSAPGESAPGERWLDLERLAEVEITSEDAAHPIESALRAGADSGWRAATPGPQTIRLLFTPPRPLHRIRLEFVETGRERTQEYVLRWSADAGAPRHEIVRQQWNFSPRGAPRQAQDHHVDLPAVAMLELVIDPDRSGAGAFASLQKLQLA